MLIGHCDMKVIRMGVATVFRKAIVSVPEKAPNERAPGVISMLRVVYWNNIPSPYMVDRFNALAANAPFEFEAWFSDRCHGDRSWTVDESTWRFPYR